MAEPLNIPEEAIGRLVDAVPLKDIVARVGHDAAWDATDLIERAVRAATPLIVAAELERLADQLPNLNCGSRGYQDARNAAVVTMVARARELRGEQDHG